VDSGRGGAGDAEPTDDVLFELLIRDTRNVQVALDNYDL
jgi:hypothetical protein